MTKTALHRKLETIINSHQKRIDESGLSKAWKRRLRSGALALIESHLTNVNQMLEKEQFMKQLQEIKKRRESSGNTNSKSSRD